MKSLRKRRFEIDYRELCEFIDLVAERDRLEMSQYCHEVFGEEWQAEWYKRCVGEAA